MSRMELNEAMRALAVTPENRAPLPDPGLVWQRAVNRERWRQYERATRSIRVAETAACVVCGAAGLAALFSLVPDIGATLRGMDPTIVRFAGLALAGTASIAVVLFRALLADR